MIKTQHNFGNAVEIVENIDAFVKQGEFGFNYLSNETSVLLYLTELI